MANVDKKYLYSEITEKNMIFEFCRSRYFIKLQVRFHTILDLKLFKNFGNRI